jgi:hypothetical protein
MKRTTKTKTAAFLARVEKLAGMAAKDGPEGERIRLAMREALLAPGPALRKERGGALEAAIHCMHLTEINAKGHERKEPVAEHVSESADPESALVYLASAAEMIEIVMDAASAELDRAEADNGARRRARRAA